MKKIFLGVLLLFLAMDSLFKRYESRRVAPVKKQLKTEPFYSSH